MTSGDKVLYSDPAPPPGRKALQLHTLLGALARPFIGAAQPADAATIVKTTPRQRATEHNLDDKVVQRLTSDTVRIQEEERRKLGLALHDDTAQILGNLVLMMDACLAIAPDEAPQLRRYLRKARETAKDGFRRVQRLSVELRPPMLDDLGLGPTIVWYTERFSQDTEIPVSVSVPERMPELNDEQESALFRIAQEALQNVRKHGQAKHIAVSLEPLPCSLRLVVIDDGIGFDSDLVAEKLSHGIHLGLAGMRYRAELLKGTFEIISASGKGTRVISEIPVYAGAEVSRG